LAQEPILSPFNDNTANGGGEKIRQRGEEEQSRS